MMSKRLKPGDILQLEVAGGFAYLQYLGKHQDYGDAVQVSPARPQPWSRDQPNSLRFAYVTFYPATAAMNQGLVEIVGHAAAPAVPRQLRRAGARADGNVKTWVIEDGSNDVAKPKLSADELQLPIAAIWNHEMLVQRIATNWDPRQEGASS